MLRTLLLVLLFLVPLTVQAQPVPLMNAVKVTGAELPEWVVWSMTFQTLAANHGKNHMDTRLLEDHLTPAELKTVFAEAQLHEKTFDALNKALQATLEPMMKKGEAEEKISAEERRLKLAYRRQVVEARDRILLALSPESTVIMHQHAARVRDTTTIYAHAPDYKSGFFWLPQ